MRFWKEKTVEELNQEFPDFEISQPLAKKSERTQSLENLEDKKFFDAKVYSQKLLSTLSTFVGVYLTYASSLIIFQVFIANLAQISTPLIIFIVFLIGLILTFLGTERVKDKSYYLLFLSVPFISIIIAFLFTLAPANWHGRLYGGFSLFFFPLVLFTFYFIKENVFYSKLEKL